MTPRTKRSPKPRKRRGNSRPAPKASWTLPVVEGVLSVTPRHFGFVSADDGGPDIFVPANAIGPAMHGDRVRVQASVSEKGRDGRIVGIVSRRPAEVTGTIRGSSRNAWFEPDDARLRSPMRIQRKPKEKLRADQNVLAQICVFPQRANDTPEVEILEPLGKKGSAEVEVRKIKIRENVQEEFPDDVKKQAKAYASQVPEQEKKKRTDLRKIDLITIDPKTARDHDDAVWAKKTKNGFRVVIAIADVSHYVPEGSPIDREAIARSTSIYLPDRAIPMLPEELSSNLASLVPQKDRLCLAIDIHLSARGAVQDYKLIEGIMRSGARVTYEGAARALGLTDSGSRQAAAQDRISSLRALHDLSRLLRARRLQRGALDFDLPEAKVELNESNGEPVSITQSRRDPGVREAYQMIEEMMILANEVVAADIKKRGLSAIFRAHAKPDAEKILLFCRLANSFGYQISPEEAMQPKILSKFLKRIEGTDHARILRYLLLRSMQQAVYDTNPDIGHFGLATKDYLHFTSPIRRYPDLTVHRVVRKIIRDESMDAAALKSRLQRAANQASRLERRAMVVEREVKDLYRVLFMQDRLGEEFDGVISGISPHGLYVSIEQPFVECFVPMELLDEAFELDELGIRLIGLRSAYIFSMGDKIRVRLEDANIAHRKLICQVLEHQAQARPETKKGAKAKKKDKPKKHPKKTKKTSRKGSKGIKRRGSKGPTRRRRR